MGYCHVGHAVRLGEGGRLRVGRSTAESTDVFGEGRSGMEVIQEIVSQVSEQVRGGRGRRTRAADTGGAGGLGGRGLECRGRAVCGACSCAPWTRCLGLGGVAEQAGCGNTGWSAGV